MIYDVKYYKYNTQAVRWEGDNLSEVFTFTNSEISLDNEFVTYGDNVTYYKEYPDILFLRNPFGSNSFKVLKGDWIVKTKEGAFIPCPVLHDDFMLLKEEN